MHERYITRCSWFPMHSEEEHEVPNNLIAWLTELRDRDQSLENAASGLIHIQTITDEGGPDVTVWPDLGSISPLDLIVFEEAEIDLNGEAYMWSTYLQFTEQGLIHLDRDAVKFWFRLRESVSIDKKIRKESNEQSPR